MGIHPKTRYQLLIENMPHNRMLPSFFLEFGFGVRLCFGDNWRSHSMPGECSYVFLPHIRFQTSSILLLPLKYLYDLSRFRLPCVNILCLVDVPSCFKLYPEAVISLSQWVIYRWNNSFQMVSPSSVRFDTAVSLHPSLFLVMDHGYTDIIYLN